MPDHPGAGDSINSYALVSYIPGPLGLYLDRIRRELVSSCVAQSHVTVLPPRALNSSSDEARIELAEGLQNYQPFDIDLGEVELFASTSVIYLSVGTGSERLKDLHLRLNHGALGFDECHAYHPHVTLAQDFAPEHVADLFELATARWREFPDRRGFHVDRLTFVQNTTQNRWMDLADFPLGHPVLTGH